MRVIEQYFKLFIETLQQAYRHMHNIQKFEKKYIRDLSLRLDKGLNMADSIRNKIWGEAAYGADMVDEQAQQEIAKNEKETDEIIADTFGAKTEFRLKQEFKQVDASIEKEERDFQNDTNKLDNTSLNEQHANDENR